VKPNINLLEVHPQLINKGASNGWCDSGCWFILTLKAYFIDPWVNQHPHWYHGKNPKIHLNISEAYKYVPCGFDETKLGSPSSNLTFFWGA
jgi:hypothetical protein